MHFLAGVGMGEGDGLVELDAETGFG